MSSFKIKKLDWESTFFGFEVGKIEIFNSLNTEQIPKIISQSPFLLIQLFSKINLSGFLKTDPIDIKLTYFKKVPKKTSFDNIYIKSANEDLDGSLVSLAKEAGIYSRFKKDNSLNSKFEKMYELWMNKSLERELANEVFVHQKEKINGMVTIKKIIDEAKIGLMSVNSDLVNKGIGTQLLKSVESWSIDLNLKSISVATQQENYKACAFYEKNNFIVREKIYIYHIWKKK
tara:strand:- start:2218 stop:2910 length:693 start_codon:yes stop_codon:yes gene_type:complete